MSINIKKAKRKRVLLTREQAERVADAFKEWNAVPPSPILKEAIRNSPLLERWPTVTPAPGRGRFNQPLVGEKSMPTPPLTTGAGTIKRR